MAETPEQPAPAASEPTKATTEVKTEVKTDTQVKDIAAPPKDTAKEPKTVLEGSTTRAEKEILPDWPDDWREKMSGADEKFLKRLQRMKSPLDVAQWGKNAEKQWKQGADPDPFPSEGTDEDKATWRKGRGVPDKPEEYIKDFSLPDGLVIGENDKPAVNDYLAAAHQMNLPPDVVKNNLGWYFKMRDGEIQKRMDQDDLDKSKTAEELKAEYGQEFKKYLRAAHGLLEAAPDGVLEALTEARMRDGTKLGNHPQIVRWLSQVALELNPAATIVSGTGAGALSSIETELTGLEKMMRDDRNAYFGNPAHAKRFIELTEAKQRMNKRSAA